MGVIAQAKTGTVWAGEMQFPLYARRSHKGTIPVWMSTVRVM